jgi:hypothetical protein
MIAEQHLSGRAKEAVHELLENGESLADASTWADEHQRDIKGSGPWHYVSVPLDEPRYDHRFAGSVPGKGCVVDKIHEFVAIFRDRRRPLRERRLALRFVVHLIADLHQPLHVGDHHDRGGNDTQVRWFDEGSNLHRVWDSGIIFRAGRSERSWVADMGALDTPANRAKAARGTIEEWATESLLAAREAYRVPGTNKRIRPGERLGEEYQRRNLPVVRTRLYQAGMRLALVLNAAFAER